MNRPVFIVQVRQDWGLKGSVGISGWQNLMRRYLKQEQEQADVLLGASQSKTNGAGIASDSEPQQDGAALKPSHNQL